MVKKVYSILSAMDVKELIENVNWEIMNHDASLVGGVSARGAQLLQAITFDLEVSEPEPEPEAEKKAEVEVKSKPKQTASKKTNSNSNRRKTSQAAAAKKGTKNQKGS